MVMGLGIKLVSSVRRLGWITGGVESIVDSAKP